jgi:hypothetical protein
LGDQKRGTVTGRVFTHSNNAYVSQSQQPGQTRVTHGETISPNIKDMMNTSAPICISNFITQNGGQPHMQQRPTQSRGQPRRQTNSNISGVRKTQVQPYNGPVP